MKNDAHQYLCVQCNKPVQMHYNHVGPDCAGGTCSGTFQHAPGARCHLVHHHLTHRQVKRTS